MITVWNKASYSKTKKILGKEGSVNWQKDGVNYQRYYYLYDEDELKRLLESIGFKLLHTHMEGSHSRKNFVFYVQK
jgi:hypothetical protein